MTGRWLVALAGLVCAALFVIAMATHQAGVAVITRVDCAGYRASPASTIDSVPVDGRLNVRVATWNALNTNSIRNVVGGLRSILGSADVVGVQELNSLARRRQVARSLGTFGSVSDSSREMIIWRADRLDLIDHGSVKAFEPSRAEPGAAGQLLGPKYIQWVKLRQRDTGATFYVLNQHMIATIDRSGHPDRSRPRRLALYDRQMSVTENLATQFRRDAPVFGTGDFNIDARADARVRDRFWPYVRMAQHQLSTNWAKLGYPASGTYGRRLIDYIWFTDNLTVTQQQILPRYGSDHSAVVVIGTAAAGSSTAAASASSGSPADNSAAPVSSSAHVSGLDQGQISVAQQIYLATVQVGRERIWTSAQVAKAFQIAAAVAMQESSLGADPASRHPDGNGDGGIFAQRTRPGWYGTIDQVNDPAYGTRAFLVGVPGARAVLTGLVGVPGWANLQLTVAAQRVQRSAFPDAYARWTSMAAGLLAAFSKSIDPNSVGATTTIANATCTDNGDARTDASPTACPATDQPAERVLTPDALLVLRCVAAQFPQIRTIGTYPGHQPDESRAVDIMIPDYTSPGGIDLGTRIAAWVKAHAGDLGVMYVIWREHIWSPQRASEGWRYCGGPSATCYSGPDDSAAHRNHVHVSVWGNRGTGFSAAQPIASGGGHAWVLPLAPGSYRLGCGFGCYPGHTGADLVAPDGTPVRSVTNGTVIRSESLTTNGTCTALPICGSQHVSYGNLLVIAVAGDPRTTIWYAHLSARKVSVGQQVTAGEVIAAVGHEGHVIPAGPAGAHLHFEIRQNGTPRNPIPILRAHGLHP